MGKIFKVIEDGMRRCKIILKRRARGECKEKFKEFVFEEIMTKNAQMVKATKRTHTQAHYAETADEKAKEEVKQVKSKNEHQPFW